MVKSPRSRREDEDEQHRLEGEREAMQISSLINELTEGPDLGLLGEPRVNVLRLNLSLDRKFPRK